MFTSANMDIRNFIRGLYYIFLKPEKGFIKQQKDIQSQYYTESLLRLNKQSKASVVFMIDGRTIHGGLADRLKGICSAYAYCKEKGLSFKLNANYPFDLKDYLIPNKYDWSISPENICYSTVCAKPVLLNDYQLNVKLHRFYLNRCLKDYKQIHLYSNSPFLSEKIAESFQELFKPSERVLQDLDHLRQSIGLGTKYISITTRFQQLLGDFKEVGYKTLSVDEQKKLVEKVIDKVKSLHEGLYAGTQILCTSDSITFLQEVDKLPYVHIIPGKVVHMDHTTDASFEEYEKSFLDLFMLMDAQKLLLLQTGDMYSSGFPRFAAQISNKPFLSVKF